MSVYTVIFNPLSNNSAGEAGARRLTGIMTGDELSFVDITGIKDYRTFFGGYPADANFVLCGGDGTINRFVNDMDDAGVNIPANLYYYPSGSGNDFFKDIGGDVNGRPVALGKYIAELPVVEVNGLKKKFINGIGYGIDGYCCEEGDRLRGISDKPINYTSIAIKGLLFHFKPKNARIKVDGKEYSFNHVWLAPTMNGRFFGGGMMPTPTQDRLNPERKISVMVFHGGGKLLTLIRFPKLFTGDFVKLTKNCSILSGHDITVEYDESCAAQIDGETVLNVKKVHCRSARAE